MSEDRKAYLVQVVYEAGLDPKPIFDSFDDIMDLENGLLKDYSRVYKRYETGKTSFDTFDTDCFYIYGKFYSKIQDLVGEEVCEQILDPVN